MQTTQEPITRQEVKMLFIIAFLGLTGMLGVDLHLASIPHIMVYLHTDKTHMQQSIAIFLLGMGSSMLFYGPLSDQYGRKPLVAVGLSITILACIACAFAHTIQTFLFTRLLQGIGAGVCMGLGRTILVDILRGERIATVGSYFSLVVGLSPLLAPMLGGYIQHWFGWQANFLIWGALLGIALFLYVCFCPETNKHKNPAAFSIEGLYKNYKSLLSHPIFIAATLLTGIASAATMVYATLSPFILQIQFHISPVNYGWLTGIAGVGGLISRFVAPMSIRQVGNVKTLQRGLMIFLFAALWLVVFMSLGMLNVPLIMIAIFLAIFSQSFIFPVAAAEALSPFPDKRGSAGALYGSFQVLTAFVVSAITGSFAHGGIMVLTVAYCVLSLMGLSIFFALFSKKPAMVNT